MFYTYAHYRPDGRIFYIGKGSKNRYLSLSRGAHWKNIVAKHGGFKAEILCFWRTESEAFEHEKFLIECFRGMGFDLCNQTSGGEGTSGRVLSEESLAKLKASVSGEKNGMYGRKISEETRDRMSVASKKTMSDPTVRAKIGASSKGRKHTEEARLKIKAAWLDPELRASRIDSMKAARSRRAAEKFENLVLLKEQSNDR